MIFLADAFAWVPKWTHHQLLVTGVRQTTTSYDKNLILFLFLVSGLCLLSRISDPHPAPKVWCDSVPSRSRRSQPEFARTSHIPFRRVLSPCSGPLVDVQQQDNDVRFVQLQTDGFAGERIPSSALYLSPRPYGLCRIRCATVLLEKRSRNL